MIDTFNLPPILGMLPLILLIVFALFSKSQMIGIVVGTVLCMLLSGTGLIGYGSLLSDAMGGTLVQIGLIILLSSALGKMMEASNISYTMVYSIVNKIGVRTESQAILVTMFSSVLVCGMLGTLAGGNAIIAPIIIPMVAAAGLSKSTVGAIFQNAGETGLILGPLSPAVVALLALTGISYGKMLLFAGLPYAIVWMGALFFAAKRLQKTTKLTNAYTEEFDQVFVPARRDRINTVIFLVSFLALVLYGILARQGISYLFVVMLLLTAIVGVCCGKKTDDIFATAVKGMASGLSLFVIFLLFDPMFTMMTNMGAFEALANVFSKLVNLIGAGGGVLIKALVMILGSFVGGFGVEGASVVQMQITNQLFQPILELVHMPMQLWAVALIAASRITNIIYPSANMIGQMGLARSTDMKSMLKAGWTITAVTIIFIIVYAFVGSLFFH